MILAHPHLDTVLDFSGPAVNTLVIENPDLYRQLLCDLYEQLSGGEGKLILSDEGTTLPISKWVELVDNCIHFDLNRRSLLNKVCAVMEQTSVSEDFYLKTTELLSTVESYVDALSFELPGDIVCEKCSVAGILKGVGVCLRDDYDDPMERLLDYMELVRAYDRDKLFVIQGMRSFFGDSRVELFLETALSHGYRILLLDGIAREKLPNEKRLTIDNDLCEF